MKSYLTLRVVRHKMSISQELLIMGLILLLIILFLVFGGGGFGLWQGHWGGTAGYGGPYGTTMGIGGIILLIVIVLFFTGRL